MFTNYESLSKNYEIIKTGMTKYRTELTEMQGTIAEFVGTCSKDEYIKFMNERTLDEIIGNAFTSLVSLDPGFINLVNDDITIDEYCDTWIKKYSPVS